MDEEVNGNPVLKYIDAWKVFDHIISGLLLEWHEETDLRMIITRNFFSKSAMLVRSIFTLWDIKAFQECHILYRCLVERLFYLNKLFSENSFETYEEWSFMKQYDFFARVRADGRYKAQTDKLAPITETAKLRRAELRKKNVQWKEPKAKDIANSLGRDYLYLYGYDYSSMHIHPMANDGLQDYETVTTLRSGENFPSHETVLRNSLLVFWLLISDTLKHLNAIVSPTLNHFLVSYFENLEKDSQEYWIFYYQLIEMHKAKIPWFTLPTASQNDKD